jgi:putative ABC transport system permease protein
MTLLLAGFAAASAAAGPLYGAGARQLSHAEEVASAPAEARSLTANRARSPENVETGKPFVLPYLPDFQTINGLEISGNVAGWDPSGLPLLAARSGFCAHLTVVSGRCAAADSEVLLRQDSAERLHVSPGEDVRFRFGLPGEPGTVTPLTVVGVYRPIDPADPFWAQRAEIIEATGGPIFTTERTVKLTTPIAGETVDLVGSARGFDDTATLSASLKREEDRLAAAGYTFSGGGLDGLITRLDRSDRLLRNSMIVAVLPLVLLSWLVLFLAVTGAVAQRREELGLVALRGVPSRMRWLLLSLETAIPVLAGAGPGYLLGYAAAVTLLPHAAIVPTAESAWGAAVAVGGALAAGVVAQLGALRLPVIELLRRKRNAGRSTTQRLVEAIAGAVALAAGVQAVIAGSAVNGMGLLAPLCFALGLGLLAARLLARPADRLGRRALRRGWVRVGVIALGLARRPGTTATVVLLTVVFGLLGFAFTAADVAQRAWQQRALVEVGADRVIAVSAVPVPRLLEAVRKVDPAGDFAMATERMDVGSNTPILAVDSNRLAAVVPWLDPGLAQRLRPEPPHPFLVQAGEIVLTLDFTPEQETVTSLGLRFVNASGGQVSAATTELRPGRNAYPVSIPQCANSPCRLQEIEVKFQLRRLPVRLVLGEIKDSGGRIVVTAGDMANVDRWVHPTALPDAPDMRLSATPAGLGIDAQAGAETRLFPTSTPRPLPMAGSGPLPKEITGYAGAVVYPVTSAANVPMVPRHGRAGALVDLEYADLGPSGGGDANRPEVWLNARAPADVADRLRAAGLTIVDSRTIAGEEASLHAQAPALAMRFLVAATVAAIVLGAGALLVLAALEREERDRGLAVLQPQGVRARILGVVAIGSRWAALLLSVVMGLLSAALSWALARQVVPVFADGISRVPPAALPGWEDVIRPAALAVAALAIVCVIAARISERSAR